MLGCIFLFATVIGWSSWLILQDIICRHYLDPLSVSVWVSFLAVISSAILTWFIYQNLNIWKIRTETQLIACLFSGIFGTAVTYYLQAWTIAARVLFFQHALVLLPLSLLPRYHLHLVTSRKSLRRKFGWCYCCDCWIVHSFVGKSCGLWNKNQA